MSPPRVRTLIVGAGIAGMGAGYELLARQENDFLLLEAGPRPGGVIATEAADGFVFEAGPDSWLGMKRSLTQLCRELGLGDEITASQDRARQTLILRNRRLLPLPPGWQLLAPARFGPIAATRLLSWRTKLRIAAEFFSRGEPQPPADESVAAFLGRLYGEEAVEYLAAPLLAGVYGGEPEELSLDAIAPRMRAMKREGSLGRALWRNRRQAAPAAPLFSTLRPGLQRLVDELARRIGPGRLRTRARVEQLRPSAAGWEAVLAGGERLQSERLILALPAWAAAELLRSFDTALAAELSAIPYGSAMILSLGYFQSPPLPPGFGALLPRREGKRMLACSFSHRKFPGRAPAGGALLRLFYGGRRDPAVLELDDAAVRELGLRELREILGPLPGPDRMRISRQPRAMAQYTPEHRRRRERIGTLRRRWPGLGLAGNAYQGIGIPDCLESGRAAARELAMPGESVAPLLEDPAGISPG